MENARLITEQREALEQQTATAEVLQVINASPGDLTPVFDAMLEKATRLSNADFGILWNFEGDLAKAGALHRVPTAYAEMIRAPFRPSPESGPARMMRGEGTFVIDDLLEFPPYRAGDALVRAIVDLAGARSVVISPLRKDDVTLGAITIYRQEVRPFTEKQIALLENFAAQAVIAMENARLITEQREALEQQTATAEVLQVINASPGNLAPVFDAMLEKAMRLCGAAFGSLYTYDGERIHSVAQRGVPESYAEFRAANPTEIRPLSGPARLLETRRPVHILDVRNWESYVVGNPVARALADLGGARSNLLVPLLKDDAVLGIISIYRQEVRAFSNKEIALLENFAAQAVIAMENARLLGELQQRTADLEESLDYQTATSDVLKVISRSTFDLQPVLDTVVETAARLCDADQAAIFRSDGELRWLAANHGYSPEYEASMRALGMFRIPPNSPMPGARAGLERKPVHIPDVTTVPGYSDVSIRLGGTRTALGVPLLRGDEAIGSIALSRRRIEPFTDRQIEIVRTFADQAVIAIENTRLITEQQEALEQQTATAEVLQVINASPGNLMPVFDAVLEKALRLCESAFGTLHTYDGECISTPRLAGCHSAWSNFCATQFDPRQEWAFIGLFKARTSCTQPTSPMTRYIDREIRRAWHWWILAARAHNFWSRCARTIISLV